MNSVHLKIFPRRLLVVIGLGALLATSTLVLMRPSHGARLAFSSRAAGSLSDKANTRKNSLVSVSTTTLQFSSASYVVGEGDGSATITVTRAGDTSSAVAVDYASSDGSASER